MIFAGVAVAVNVSLAMTLFPHLSALGIATAEIVAGWVNAALLFFTLVKRGHWGSDRALLKRIPMLVLSAALMSGVLHYLIIWLQPQLASTAPTVIKAATVAGLVATAMVVYFGLAFATGGADRSMLARALKRKAKPAPEAPSQE
jgi:putative peptidoglycan lipid II flippase